MIRMRFGRQAKSGILADQRFRHRIIYDEGKFAVVEQPVEMAYLCSRVQIARDFLGYQTRNNDNQFRTQYVQ